MRLPWWTLILLMYMAAARPASAQGKTTANKTGQPSASVSPQTALAPRAIDNESPDELPDSPGATLAKMEATAHMQEGSTTSQSEPAAGQTQSPSAPPQGQQAHPHRPVGTAAAPAPTPTGIAASEPAGVAIAPAKQHRVRTIVLKVGAIVGAGVALGSVIALTEATPSKPPGAH